MVIGAAVAIAVYAVNADRRKRDEARRTYQNALSVLERNPTNPALRKAALQLGRYYSSLTRNGQGVALFDEVALMNDINAVCGGSTSIVEPIGSVPAQTPSRDAPDTPGSLEDRLAKLNQLRQRDLISEQEYQAKRQALLDEI